MPSEVGRGRRFLKHLERVERRKLKNSNRRVNDERRMAANADVHLVRQVQGLQRSDATSRSDAAGAAEMGRNGSQNQLGVHERIEIEIFEVRREVAGANEDFRNRYEHSQEMRERTNFSDYFDTILSSSAINFYPMSAALTGSSYLESNVLLSGMSDNEICDHTELFPYDGLDGREIFCTINQELVLPGEMCRQLKVIRSLQIL